MPGDNSGLDSVQLAEMPEVVEDYLDLELEQKWERLLSVRGEVTKALEEARRDKLIGNSLEAVVDLYAGKELYAFLEPMSDSLATLFIVSDVTLATLGSEPASARKIESMPELAVAVRPAGTGKCERCWMYHEGVGADAGHPTLCPRCAGVIRSSF
jgi:isoleucyl-tRNA synthetase